MPGSDFLQLDAASAPRGGLTSLAGRTSCAPRSRTGGCRSAPAPGLAHAGRRPGVSRGVVVEAYQRLVDEGLVTADGARGTAVARGAAGQRTADPARRLPAAPDRPVDLSPGVPDLAAFPRAAWLRAEREVLGRTDAADLGYGDPRGNAACSAASWPAGSAAPGACGPTPTTSSWSPASPRRSPCSRRCCGPEAHARSRWRTRDRRHPRPAGPLGPRPRSRGRGRRRSRCRRAAPQR